MAEVGEGNPDPLPLAHEINPQVPALVSNALNRALAVNRNQRYESASELRRALRAAEDAEVEHSTLAIEDPGLPTPSAPPFTPSQDPTIRSPEPPSAPAVAPTIRSSEPELPTPVSAPPQAETMHVPSPPAVPSRRRASPSPTLATGSAQVNPPSSSTKAIVVTLVAALFVGIAVWAIFATHFWERTPEDVTNARAGSSKPTTGRRPLIALMPKAKGDPYFVSCKQGADEAAKELGVELLWDGPVDLDPAKQNEIVEAWITKGVDVIAVSVENKVGISTVLRKAKQKGINVITWDTDAEKDARDFLINQATPQGIGYTLADEAARILNNKGEFAIITASLSAPNQNEWIRLIKQRMAQRYPDLKLDAIQPSEGDRDRAFSETQTVLKVYPNVKLIMAIAAPALPGAAEAVLQSGRKDVKVTGLSLPNMSKPYVHSGVVESVVLWNTIDLGYLTVYAGHALATGQLRRSDKEITVGRLGKIEVADDEVRLGAPFIFNKGNIDRFDF